MAELADAQRSGRCSGNNFLANNFRRKKLCQLTAFTGVDSQNLPDVMVSVQFILAIGASNLVKQYF
ncbi:hypothetical protein ACIA3V_09210 [Lactobacillus delbrueckii subsp. bulgaricus]